MLVKEFIKCLTILIWLLSFQDVNASVKDILKIQETEYYSADLHGRQVVTRVQRIAFEEHRNDGQQVVVIDAGHGGNDSGALGKHSKEKDIALSIALKIGKTLEALNATTKVIFTRTTDVFIPLHQRIDSANKSKADLFISIHCNYVDNPHVCGTETFVMGLHRAEENLQVAKRENSSVLLESEYETHYEGYDPNSPIGHILLSMFQNVFLDNSIALASNVESFLERRKKTKSRGVKQAGFVVLRQATMPSVLIETGFLSNPQEEKYLMSETGQKEMALSISQGITTYFADQSIHFVEKKKVAQDPAGKVQERGYIVQIGVFSKPIDISIKDTLQAHGRLLKNEVNGLFKYAVGYFELKKEAYSTCEALKRNGFADAFVKWYE